MTALTNKQRFGILLRLESKCPLRYCFHDVGIYLDAFAEFTTAAVVRRSSYVCLESDEQQFQF